MAQTGMLFAGFGGQGILFSGKFCAYDGLISDKQVSWLPSYGPEMRGGTASCSVVFSDEIIGSPIVTTGNELSGAGIAEFSRKLNIRELYRYAQNLGSAATTVYGGLHCGRFVRRGERVAFGASRK